MTAKTRGSSLWQQWEVQKNQTLCNETGLIPDLAELVLQYLPPSSIKGWITEWTGERGREIVEYAIVQAGVSLTRIDATLVTQYLRKSDLFGLAELERAAGGQKQLAQLLETYDAEKPLPPEIDDEMQAPLPTPLSKYCELNSPKVTELFALYWCPAKMSGSIATKIASKHGQSIDTPWLTIYQPFLDIPTTVDAWLQFSQRVFYGIKMNHQQDLASKGYEFPRVSEAVFCIFMKYICTGERIITREDGNDHFPISFPIATACQDELRGRLRTKVIVGGYKDNTLCLANSSFGTYQIGLAPLRRYS